MGWHESCDTVRCAFENSPRRRYATGGAGWVRSRNGSLTSRGRWSNSHKRFWTSERTFDIWASGWTNAWTVWNSEWTVSTTVSTTRCRGTSSGLSGSFSRRLSRSSARSSRAADAQFCNVHEIAWDRRNMAAPRTVTTSPFAAPDPAKIRTLADVPRYVRTYFQRDVFIGRCREARDDTFSTTEFSDRVQDLAIALIARGVQPGDRVAILAPSRPEWLLADLATLSIGAVTVPVYPTLAPAQTRYILEHSQSRFVFASDLAQAAKVQSVRHLLPDLEGVVIFDLDDPAGTGAAGPAAVTGSLITLADLVTRGHELLASTADRRIELERRTDAVQPDDLATIIYTSGTTGEPKGVMLSHHNVVSNVVSCGRILGCSPADTALSFLPLSHAFERTIAYIYLYEGVKIVFAESLDTLARDLKRTRPTVMTGVPRVFEKLYARVMETRAAASAPRQKLFDWALACGYALARVRLERRQRPPLPLRLRHGIADRLVLAKIRSRTGTDRARVLVSGSAPLSREVCAFFHAVGLRLIEGYGLTETAPVLSVNPLDAPRLGTVGCAVPGVELTTAEDGEILARGPNVMLGYYKQPESTSDVLRDGWLYTGDIGTVSEDGYLTITDRKKDLLITSGGKHVAPQPIEDLLKRHPLIAEAMLIGDGRQFIAALIVPDFAVLAPRLAAAGLPALSRDATCERPETQAIYQEIVDGVNGDLAQYERVKRLALLPTEFTVEGGELTPTLKVRRSIVVARWQNVIDALYRDSAYTPKPSN
ncbi:MAG: AMP-binding protein [Luteitalea sp.]|nr:AMP-binding protein [Luteitalea sp.]